MEVGQVVGATRRRAEVSADTRETILRAALRAFAERGYDGASARDIATAAGVNHGLIRYHFGGKPKLWQAAVDRAFAELEAGLDALLADMRTEPARERVARLIRSYVRFVGRRPEFVRLMHEEGKRRGPRMRWLVDRHVSRLYAGISELVSREPGVLRVDMPPIHLHYVLAGSVGLLFHQAEECKRLSGVDPFDPDVIEEHARIVCELLLGPSQEDAP